MIITWTYTETDNVDVPVLTEDFDSGIEIETFQVTHQYEPINAGLSTKSFCAYKDHPWITQIRAKAEAKFKKEWLAELGFDSNLWRILEDGTVEEIGKVKEQHQIDAWVKPNGQEKLTPIEVEEI